MRGSLFHYKLYVLLLLAAVFTGSLVACSKQSQQSNRKPQKMHLVEAATVRLVHTGVNRIRTGTLRARREIKVYSQEEGRVTALPFYEGDKVTKGQVVARLDDELLRSQLARAQATRHKADEDLKRIRDLYKKKLTTDEELSRIETEQEVAKADVELLTTRLGYTVIKAPIDGVVSSRLSESGNVVEKHTHLLTISDPSSLVTEVSLSELIMPQIAIDDPVKVTIDALGQAIHNGRILRIHPTLDPVTRRGTVEVELKPVPNGARPGQLCRVEFTTKVAERLVIPFRAIRRDDQGEYVYVLLAPAKSAGKADEKAVPAAEKANSKEIRNGNHQTSTSAGDDGTLRVANRVAIHSGLRIGEQVEILQGLQEHQQVVIRGFLDLSEGTAVKIVNSPVQAGARPEAAAAAAGETSNH